MDTLYETNGHVFFAAGCFCRAYEWRVVDEREAKQPKNTAGLLPALLHNTDFFYIRGDHFCCVAENGQRDERVRHPKSERKPGSDPEHH